MEYLAELGTGFFVGVTIKHKSRSSSITTLFRYDDIPKRFRVLRSLGAKEALTSAICIGYIPSTYNTEVGGKV